MLVPVFITVLFLKTSVGIIYDSYTGEPASDERVEYYKGLNILENCTNDIVLPCDDTEMRRLDGSCNNAKYPASGTYHTPLKYILKPMYNVGNETKTCETGEPLPPERVVRTRILLEGKASSTEHTELFTIAAAIPFADSGSVHDTMNYLRETTHCCTEEGKNDHMCAPIEVPADDPTHRFSGIRCLNLTRPKSFQSYGCAAANTDESRIEFNSPLLDLSFIYRSTVPAPEYRAYEGGLLLFETEDDSVWPSSQGPHNVTSCLANVRENGETRCWGPVQGSIPPVTIGTVWYYRLHNIVATELGTINPHWSDDKLFNITREIVIAIYNQLNYYEMLPATMGKEYTMKAGLISNDSGFRDLYNKDESIQASFDYIYAWRWFHILQEGSMKMYDEDNYFLQEIPTVNLTLRVGYLSQNNNFAKIVRGVFLKASGKYDRTVDPDISEMGLGGMQKTTDLCAADLRKGRLFKVQPYVNYLEYCGFEKPKSWKDLENYINLEVIEQLKRIYPSVDCVDFLVGAWGEYKLKGGSIAPIVACLQKDYYYRLMVSDRHWYESSNRPGAFTYDQLQEIRKASYAYLICVTERKIKTIQRYPLWIVSDENPLVSCDDIVKPDFNAWKEDCDD